MNRELDLYSLHWFFYRY